MNIEFCEVLPKLELHAHLNGSISEETLRELHVSDKTIEDFLKMNKVLNLGPSRTLEECFKIFQIAHSVTNNRENVIKATQDVIKEFCDDGVLYLELRTTPRNEENMTKNEYIEAVIDAIINCRTTVPNINVKLILSLNRKQSEEEAENTIELAKEYNKKHPDIIVGLDVGGDPTKGTWFKPLLEQIEDKSTLKFTIHCAEVATETEINDILDFNPSRIGHGVCINPETGGTVNLWNKLLEKKIVVECCLTSNVKTKTIENYELHYLKELIKSNHPFALCTDDKGVFSTSLSQEFKIAADIFGLSKNDLWKISYQTIDYAFCTEKEKEEMRKYLKEWYSKNLLQETTV